MADNKLYQDLFPIPLEAGEDLAADRFVKPSGAYADAGELALGVTRSAAADGTRTTIDPLGIRLIEKTNAEIAQDDEIAAAADGKAVTLAGVAKRNGIALEAAAAADTHVRVFITH